MPAPRPYYRNAALQSSDRALSLVNVWRCCRLGLPVTPHMANLTTPMARAQVQLGFINFIVEPVWSKLVVVLPNAQSRLDNLQVNTKNYADKAARAREV